MRLIPKALYRMRKRVDGVAHSEKREMPNGHNGSSFTCHTRSIPNVLRDDLVMWASNKLYKWIDGRGFYIPSVGVALLLPLTRAPASLVRLLVPSLFSPELDVRNKVRAGFTTWFTDQVVVGLCGRFSERPQGQTNCFGRSPFLQAVLPFDINLLVIPCSPPTH